MRQLPWQSLHRSAGTSSAGEGSADDVAGGVAATLAMVASATLLRPAAPWGRTGEKRCAAARVTRGSGCARHPPIKFTINLMIFVVHVHNFMSTFGLP